MLGIDGLDHMLEARSPERKVIWLLLVIAAAGVLSASLTKSISKWLSEPYVVSAAPLPITSFPTVGYYPAFTANLSKIERMGLTLEHYLYIGTRFAANRQFSPLQQRLTFTRPFNQMDQELTAVLVKRQESLSQLYIQMSLDTEVTIPMAKSSTFGTVTPVVTHLGFGFGVVRNKSISQFEVLSMTANFFIPYRLVEGPAGLDVPASDTLVLGEKATILYPEPQLPLVRANQMTDISLSVGGYQSTASQGCSSAALSYADVDLCISGCVSDACEKDGLCRPDIANLTLHTCTTALDRPEGRCMHFGNDTLMDQCMNRCPVPCTRYTYTVAMYHSSYPMNKEQTRYIVLRYANAATAQMYREENLYTWDNVVGSLGGMVSLWFGASLMTLPQLAFTLYDHACRPERGKAPLVGNSRLTIK